MYPPRAWIFLVWLLIGEAAVHAQQARPGTTGNNSFPLRSGPLAIEQPRELPPGGAVAAQPRASKAPPPAPFSLSASQSPIRPTSAEAVGTAPARPPLRLAPRDENTHVSAGAPTRRAPSSVTGTLSTVGGSLGIVLGLLLVITWCCRRYAPAGAMQLPKEAVELLGQAPLTTRQRMHLLRVGNKLILLGLSPSGAQPLAEITEAAEVEHLTALCRRRQPGSSSAAFRRALGELSSEPATASFVGTAATSSRGGR
jgi:flagellar protein FliO/FliZ